MDLYAENVTLLSHDVGARTYYPYFSIGSGPTVMTRVQCTGRETNLLNCSYRTDSSSIRYCDYYDYYYYYYYYGFGFDAGVRCKRGTRIDSIINYSKSISSMSCMYTRPKGSGCMWTEIY